MTDQERKADFGFEKVPWAEKADRVRAVFSSVAGKYDVMNDLMSFGVHRLWKQFTLSLTGLTAGQSALDVAGGTGDLTRGLARQVGKTGRVVLSDINRSMLETGRDRLLDLGYAGNVESSGRRRGTPALRRWLLRLRDHWIRTAQRHRQDGGARLHVPGTQARRPAPGAGVLEARRTGAEAAVRRLFIQLAAAAWGAWWPRTPRATAISPNPSACTRTRRPCSAMLRAPGFRETRYHNLTGGIVAVHRGYKI